MLVLDRLNQLASLVIGQVFHLLVRKIAIAKHPEHAAAIVARFIFSSLAISATIIVLLPILRLLVVNSSLLTHAQQTRPCRQIGLDLPHDAAIRRLHHRGSALS